VTDLTLFRALIVGAGGFLGAAARYLLGGFVQRWSATPFPSGTFLINVTGCLGIGFLAALAEERPALGPEARLFWMAGVLGGYTTFSTFGYETVTLARDGSYALAAANVLGQVALGLLAVWAGAWLARAIT
jgi:CrcB protein